MSTYPISLTGYISPILKFYSYGTFITMVLKINEKLLVQTNDKIFTINSVIFLSNCTMNKEQVEFEFLNCSQDGIYLFKVNNGNTRTMCEICSKLTIKTPERRHRHRFWCLYCELWTDITHCSCVFIVDFEQVNAGWV